MLGMQTAPCWGGPGLAAASERGQAQMPGARHVLRTTQGSVCALWSILRAPGAASWTGPQGTKTTVMPTLGAPWPGARTERARLGSVDLVVGSAVLSPLAGGMRGLNQKPCLSDSGECYVVIRIFSAFSIIRKNPAKNNALLPVHLPMWESQ